MEAASHVWGRTMITRWDAQPTAHEAQRGLDQALIALRDMCAETAAVPQAREALELVREARRLLASPPGPRLPGQDRDGGLKLVREIRLAATARAAAAARAFCVETCAPWEIPSATLSSVLDVVSELVANACRHTRSDVAVLLELDAVAITVRVWDDGPGHPQLLPYRAGLTDRGIGMHLVRRLSLHWGYSPDQQGKWVWAVLSREPCPGAGR